MSIVLDVEKYVQTHFCEIWKRLDVQTLEKGWKDIHCYLLPEDIEEDTLLIGWNISEDTRLQWKQGLQQQYTLLEAAYIDAQMTTVLSNICREGLPHIINTWVSMRIDIFYQSILKEKQLQIKSTDIWNNWASFCHVILAVQANHNKAAPFLLMRIDTALRRVIDCDKDRIFFESAMSFAFLALNQYSSIDHELKQELFDGIMQQAEQYYRDDYKILKIVADVVMIALFPLLLAKKGLTGRYFFFLSSLGQEDKIAATIKTEMDRNDHTTAL